MMNKRLNLLANFKQIGKQIQEDNGVRYVEIEGMASTIDEDRVGDVILPEAWELENFELNPIILFNHNYNEPIGKATEIAVIPEGLRIKCRIYGDDIFLTKIAEGVLSTFSVGFIFKDGRYEPNTNTFYITAAELLEVSVVSVPANPTATFEVEKALNDKEGFEKLKAKLSRQSAKSNKGINMDPDNDNSQGLNVDDIVARLDEKAKKREQEKEEQARREQKAKDQKEADLKAAKEAAEKAAKDAVDSTLEEKGVTWVETTAEAVLEQVSKKLEESNNNFTETIKEFKDELENFGEEIKRINDAKRRFGTQKGEEGQEGRQQLIEAKLMSLILEKDIGDFKFGQEVLEKTGIAPAATTELDEEIGNEMYKEIMLEQGVASLFRRLRVNGKATHIPVQQDVKPASFNTGAATDTAGRLQGLSDTAADTYTVKEKTLQVHRLISETHILDNTDETILVSIMPMMRENVVRAHAVAVDQMCIRGNTTPEIEGLGTVATGADPTGTGTASFDRDISDGDVLSGDNLLAMRAQMGKWGLEPSEVVYIVPIQQYYELLQDADFQDVDQVSDRATKIRGSVGAIWGSQVVVSDAFEAIAAGKPVALAVNARGFVIPELKQVTVERDREVRLQRDLIVASQQIGFDHWQPAVIDGSAHATEAPCVALLAVD